MDRPFFLAMTETTSIHESQLKTIIEAAVAKAVAETQAALAPMLAAADAKNKGLLADLKKAQGKPEPEIPTEPKTVEDVMTAWNASMAARDAAEAERAAKAKPAPKAPGLLSIWSSPGSVDTF